jgi:RNA polymerase subunit RPABC4/transcription elongation factor Spt4
MNPPESEPQDCQHCGTAVDPLANFCPQCGNRVGDDSFCSSCGELFGSGDEFCSECGHPRPNTANESDPVDPRHGETDEAFRKRVRDHLEAGWELKSDNGDQVTLADRGIGSIPVHILLLLVGGGVWNLIYGWYHYSALAEYRYLSVGDGRQPQPPGAPADSTTAEADTTNAVLSYLAGGVVGFLAIWFLFATASGSLTLLFGVLGLVFLLGGLAVLPPVRRRLARRHAITKFGRQKTVDHRISYPHEEHDELCVVCNKRDRSGLLRRRRDETVVGGVPLVTHSLEHNFYCRRCAAEDFSGGDIDLNAVVDEEAEMSTAELN